MGIMIDVPMPINCVDCDNRAIRPLIGCKLIFQGCANCGRHPNCPIVEAIPKADYENRLKADMVAILEDLQLELEELPKAQFYKQNENGDVIGCIEYPAISKGALLLIQEKINSLKENTIE